ncbi:MAG: DNA adenine methylase, partial [Gemmiger sp.]|nr:DNA adenine methylase [Gemmiger sp.]
MKKIVPIIFQTLENRGVPMNPVLKYRGGKSREIPRFLQYIPDDFNHYIEPFFGGGAVFFY